MTTKKYIITADDVEDNLTSTLQDVPLSANQGRVLNTGKVDKNQGTAQAGKVLGIGADGLVYAMSAGTAAHASSHASGGSDAVSLAASQITSGTLAAARLPKATTSAFGAVKVGSGLSVSSGVISVSGGGSPTMNISNSTTSAEGYLNFYYLIGESKPGTKITAGGALQSAYAHLLPYPTSGTFTPLVEDSYYIFDKLAVKTYSATGSVSTTTLNRKTMSGKKCTYDDLTLSRCVRLDVSGYYTSPRTGWTPALIVSDVSVTYS